MNADNHHIFRYRKQIIATLLFLTLVLAVKRLIIFPHGSPGIDYAKHYYAAEKVIKGGSPYVGDGMYLSFNYPQFVAWINIPLLIFGDVGQAKRAWDVFNIFLVLMTAGVAIWGCKPTGKGLSKPYPDSLPGNNASPGEAYSGRSASRLFGGAWWAPVLFITFFYSPNTDGIRPGNIAPWVLFSTTVLGWLIIREKEYGVGVLIALCSLIKLMPALLIAPYLIGRRRRVLLGASLTWIAYLLLLLFTGAARNEWFYLTRVLPHIGQKWSYVSYSLPYVFARHFARSLYDNPHSMKLLTMIWMSLLLISYLVMCGWRRDLMREKKGHILIFTLGVLLLPILAPLLEYHHFVWAFPGFMCIFYLVWLGGMPGWYIWLCFWLFLGLSVAGPMAEVFRIGGFNPIGFTPPLGLLLYIATWILILKQPQKGLQPVAS